MTVCSNCKTEKALKWIYREGKWYCGDCTHSPIPDLYTTLSPSDIKSKRFMRDDRRWKADIQSRKTLPNGTVARFDPKGRRFGW